MSTDERSERTRRRWPMSPVNTVIVGFCLVAAVVAYVAGNNVPGTAFLLAGLFGGVAAVLARRASSGDLERINALEYADERDRLAATKGLAVVGAVALLAAIVQLVVHVILQTQGVALGMSVGLVLLLTAAWFVGNWYAVRRG